MVLMTSRVTLKGFLSTLLFSILTERALIVEENHEINRVFQFEHFWELSELQVLHPSAQQVKVELINRNCFFNNPGKKIAHKIIHWFIISAEYFTRK